MKTRRLIVLFSVLTISFIICACKNRSEEVINGVIYAKNALSSATANPLSRASYDGIISNGGTPLDYVKATLPKTDPVFDSWEWEKPTHAWTIVIRPGTDPGEYWIEGYGADLKKPIKVDRVTLPVPEE